MFTFLLIFILLLGLIALKIYTDKQNEPSYDERQLLLQKKAYVNAAWAVLLTNLVIAVEASFFETYISLSFLGMANIFIILLVYVSSSILTDAYFTRHNKTRFLALYGLIATIRPFVVYRQWQEGRFFHAGHLYLTAENATNLLLILTLGLIFLVTAYKAWTDQKEEEEGC